MRWLNVKISAHSSLSKSSVTFSRFFAVEKSLLVVILLEKGYYIVTILLGKSHYLVTFLGPKRSLCHLFFKAKAVAALKPEPFLT